MAYALIDYGDGGRAEIWGDFTKETAVRAYDKMANECFGIRKTIMNDELLEFDVDATMPAPWINLNGASKMLKHNCGGGWPAEDIAVWGADGEKIKSEWD